MKILSSVFAAEPVPTNLGQLCGTGFGPFGKCVYPVNGGATALTNIASIISSVIGVMTLAAGVWFLFQILIGGFGWMTAGGDKSKLETARHRITDAFVGLVVVVAGWGILALMAQFFDIDFLFRNPETIIQNVNPGN